MIDEIPENLLRYWSNEAINKLAERFNLSTELGLTDWPFIVADESRVDEFIDAYLSANLDDDEYFVLMDILLQSVEPLVRIKDDDPAWIKIQHILEQHIERHIYTVCYWADLDNDDLNESWSITPYMRQLLAINQKRFFLPHNWPILSCN